MFDKRELATVLAALRLWQYGFHLEKVQHSGVFTLRVSGEQMEAIDMIARDSGSVRPLDFDEINSLCKRLNAAANTRLMGALDWIIDGIDAGERSVSDQKIAHGIAEARAAARSWRSA